MEKKVEYAATYQFGKTTVHVVAPPLMSEEEKKRIIRDFHNAGWVILRGIEKRAEIMHISKTIAYEVMEYKNFPLIRIGRCKKVNRDEFFKWLQSRTMSNNN